MERLELRLLGGFHFSLGGESVTAFESDGARALLAYLAVESGRSHHRESLAGLFWPERPPKSSLNNLRQTIYRLRHALARADPSVPFLVTSSRDIRLNPAVDCWLDTQEFVAELDEVRRDHRHGDRVCEECVARLHRAVELFRGEFLAGLSLPDSGSFAEWVLCKQEEYHSRALDALYRLATHCEQVGQVEEAALFARRQIELEPWREEAYRQMMRAMAMSGQRVAALRQYDACRRILATELKTRPTRNTTQLYESIRNGTFEFGIAEEPSAATASSPRGMLRYTPTFRFAGRKLELEVMNRALADALSRRGRVLFVTGEAGSGKTTLMAHFARQAEVFHPELLVAIGGCDAITGAGDPYLPFREVFRLLIGDVENPLESGVITQEGARRILAAVPATAQALAEVGPDLINLLVPGEILARHLRRWALGLTPAWMGRLEELVRGRATVREMNRGSGGRTGAQSQGDLLSQVTAVLQAIARRHPLLLLLDDLQWVDSGSAGMLFHLGRRLSGSRIVVVAAYRPEELSAGDRGEKHPLRSIATELLSNSGDLLVDLDQSEGREFVDAYLDTEPNRLGEAFRARLYRQAGGHALFTVELLRGLQARGELVRDHEGFWTEETDMQWERLPARVEAAIADRVDALPVDWQAILDVASVEGEEFEAEVVSRVLEMDVSHVVDVLSGPLSRRVRLVTACGPRSIESGERYCSVYRFRHYLFQQHIYGQLDDVKRARLHRAVVQELESLYGDRGSELAVRLAYHYEKAGLSVKAADCLLQAGRRAGRLRAYEEAADLLDRRLSLLATLPAIRERATKEILSEVYGWLTEDYDSRSLARVRELFERLEASEVAPVPSLDDSSIPLKEIA